MRLLFHGTSHPIRDLASAHIGKGGDPNSALGFHTTDSPIVGAEYASISLDRDTAATSGRVVAILATSDKSSVVSSFNEFFGTDEVGDYFKTHEDFATWRKKLLSDGFDLLEMEGHEDEIVVILDPASNAFNIVAELSHDEAITLGEYYEEEGLTYDDTDRRVELLKKVILERQPVPMMNGLSL